MQPFKLLIRKNFIVSCQVIKRQFMSRIYQRVSFLKKNKVCVVYQVYFNLKNSSKVCV